MSLEVICKLIVDYSLASKSNRNINITKVVFSDLRIFFLALTLEFGL